jgi:hypothetical protein
MRISRAAPIDRDHFPFNSGFQKSDDLVAA